MGKLNAESIEYFDEDLQLSPNDPNGWVSESPRSTPLAGESRYDEALAGLQRGSNIRMQSYGRIWA